MTNKLPDISVVIVSYNTADLIADCLNSVFSVYDTSTEVFVIDNASTDASSDLIRKEFPNIQLIVNETNRGYGAANNQGIKESNGRYIVLLNPDTTVNPQSFQKMIAYMESHPEVGLAGPKVINPDGSRQDSVSLRYPGHRYGAADLGPLPGEIACVLGACQIVQTRLIQQLGGFDEDFFLYGEDQDLCLRIRKKGLKIGFIDEAVIMHHGGQSERNTLPAEVIRKKVRAEYLFYRKHYTPKSIRQIRSNQNMRALWRIFSIRLLLPFMHDKEQAEQKLARYRVIREESNTILGLKTSDISGKTPFNKDISDGEFHFQRLEISGIDNEPVLSRNDNSQREEEIILFHRSVVSGDHYVSQLAERVRNAIDNHANLPVVRFADGEYEFYAGSLKCNGLYHQAESVAAIRAAIPAHIESLRSLAELGIIAPLVFPGNIRRENGLRSLFRKKSRKDMALRFLEFLHHENINLTGHNYIPFYAVYAYLSSHAFAEAVNGKTICILNSDFNAAACAGWFERAGSYPNIFHVKISDSYVATKWDSMREEVFGEISATPDCFMVGAGVGALQICVDAARRYSVPAIDSGHILNVMNDLESKSQGPRLYTFQR